jgi:hypothetical protein
MGYLVDSTGQEIAKHRDKNMKLKILAFVAFAAMSVIGDES